MHGSRATASQSRSVGSFSVLSFFFFLQGGEKGSLRRARGRSPGGDYLPPAGVAKTAAETVFAGVQGGFPPEKNLQIRRQKNDFLSHKNPKLKLQLELQLANSHWGHTDRIIIIWLVSVIFCSKPVAPLDPHTKKLLILFQTHSGQI